MERIFKTKYKKITLRAGKLTEFKYKFNFIFPINIQIIKGDYNNYCIELSSLFWGIGIMIERRLL